jgi:hypothetical protein
MMNNLSIYLFTQSTDDSAPPLVRRRLNALVALRDELLQLGDLRVSASPQDADLHVEILSLLGSDEVPIARAAQHAAENPDRRRILIVRVSRDQKRFDFVCSDGAGSASAERQAARRIHASVDQLPASLLRSDTLLTHPC